MRRIASLILAAALVLGLSTTAFAYRVRGYYRSNGTYVQPYERSYPNAYRYDNYNYRSGTERYNRSYYYPTRNYSSDWYTPYRNYPSSSYRSSYSDYDYSPSSYRSYYQSYLDD